MTGGKWQVTGDKWQVSGEKWQVTGDAWFARHDTWNATHDIFLLVFSQLPTHIDRFSVFGMRYYLKIIKQCFINKCFFPNANFYFCNKVGDNIFGESCMLVHIICRQKFSPPKDLYQIKLNGGARGTLPWLAPPHCAVYKFYLWHFFKWYLTFDIRHLIPVTCHLSPDTLHVTPDTQGWWTLSKHFRSLALTVW